MSIAAPALPAPPRASAISRLDAARLEELRRLRASGMSDLDAWTMIAQDPRIGVAKVRAAGVSDAVRALRIANSLGSFLRRVAPGAVEQAAATVRVRLAEAAPAAAQRIIDTAAGNFGVGKVVTRGFGENAEEEVVVDAPAARVALDAAKFVVQAVGVGEKAGGAAVAAVQVNVNRGPTAHEMADALDRDPDLREKVIDLARAARGNA